MWIMSGTLRYFSALELLQRLELLVLNLGKSLPDLNEFPKTHKARRQLRALFATTQSMRIEPVLEDDCARELIGKNLLNKTHGFWVGRLKRLKSVQKLHPIVHFLILTEKPERALLQRSLARYVQ